MALGGASVVDDAEPAATIALASAMLVSEYGLDEAASARAAANAVEAAPSASERAQSLKLASRALLEVAAGHLDEAEGLVRQSLSLGHKQASPLFVLGRVRLRQGNLAAASHAFQAALVREPNFIEARVAWAEAWIEQGEPEKARENLLKALEHTPDHSRARLLLTEVDPTAVDLRESSTCARDEGKSPFIASACALIRAQRAARSDDSSQAVRSAEVACLQRPADPWVLGRAAGVLAAMGNVDQAAACLDEATRIANRSLPSLRWGQVGIELGRGKLVDLADAPKVAASPWAPLFVVRNALASGGIKALTVALREVAAKGPQIEAFESLAQAGSGAATLAAVARDPVRNYLKGMQARLQGKPALAAELLAKALEEHGDACRAAGEYLAASRELGRTPDDDALGWLRRENSQCVNLPERSVDKPMVRRGPARISH
jgi:tetratricopeptide (TPR) repeat protein